MSRFHKISDLKIKTKDKMEGSCGVPKGNLNHQVSAECWIGCMAGGVLPEHFLWIDTRTCLLFWLLFYLSTNPRGLPSGVGAYTFCVIYSQSTVRENQRSILTGLTIGKLQIHSLSGEEVCVHLGLWIHCRQVLCLMQDVFFRRGFFSPRSVWARGGQP